MDNYFFRGLRYGSDVNWSPINVILNKGMSPLQFSNRSRKLSATSYADGLSNVWYTLTHPKETIETTGVHRWFTTEIFPLNFEFESGKWFPNYTEHFVGGGVTYTAMREWYRFHGLPHDWLLAGLTTMGAAVLNEVVENTGRFRTSGDHLADIFVFDIPGVLFFNLDIFNRIFSETFQVADWSPQASFTPAGEVHNNGQYMAWHIDLPFLERASVFWRLGFGGLLGGGYELTDTDRLSIGFGVETSEQLIQNASTNEFTISTEYAAGFFYDRNNSLLASLILTQLEKDFISINIYPGVVPWLDGSLGLWAVFDQDLVPALGVTVRQLMGTGFGLNW